MKYQLFTDGGARGNPGPAGIGIVIKNDKREKVYETCSYIGEATNNKAEYAALIKGLEIAQEKGFKNLECFLDSELIVKQMNGLYKVKDAGLKILWKKAKEISLNFETIEFKHVLREKNQDADAMVNKALDDHLYYGVTGK
jgi:ribonuclease HI